MQVAIYGPNLRDQSKGSFVVHAAGCACAKLDRYSEIVHHIDATDIVAVVTDTYDPGDFDYNESSDDEISGYLADFHFFPCTKGLPYRAVETTRYLCADEPSESESERKMICPECGVTLQVLSDGRYSAVVADDGTTQESDVCPRCGDAVKLADTLAELPSTPSMMSRRDRERAEQAAAVGISYTPSLIDDRARIGIALNFYIDRCNWSTEDDERSEYERLEREYTPEHLRHLIDR